MALDRISISGYGLDMDEKDEAITELAHVAKCLLERLMEIDPHVPRHGVIAYSIENKINFYEGVASNE